MNFSTVFSSFQLVEVMGEDAKQGRLMQVLKEITKETDCKTIIFTATKRRADKLTKWLIRDGFQALAIHGNKSQNAREKALGGERMIQLVNFDGIYFIRSITSKLQSSRRARRRFCWLLMLLQEG